MKNSDFIGRKIGIGQNRIVYEHSRHPELVVKYARYNLWICCNITEYNVWHNANEHERLWLAPVEWLSQCQQYLFMKKTETSTELDRLKSLGLSEEIETIQMPDQRRMFDEEIKQSSLYDQYQQIPQYITDTNHPYNLGIYEDRLVVHDYGNINEDLWEHIYPKKYALETIISVYADQGIKTDMHKLESIRDL